MKDFDPACSAQELSHILAEPTTRYCTAILSWLSDDPNTGTGAGEIKIFFSRQLARWWWNVGISQWSNRALGDGEEGLSLSLRFPRQTGADMRGWLGAHAMVSAHFIQRDPSGRQWEHTC